MTDIAYDQAMRIVRHEICGIKNDIVEIEQDVDILEDRVEKVENHIIEVQSPQRFGIEDNQGEQNRHLEMSTFGLHLDHPAYFYVDSRNDASDTWARLNVSTLPSEEQAFLECNIATTHAFRIGATIGDVEVYMKTPTAVVTMKFPKPDTGEYNLPLSVNNIFPDDKGNIVIPVGRFGVEDNVSTVDRVIDMQAHDLNIINTDAFYVATAMYSGWYGLINMSPISINIGVDKSDMQGGDIFVDQAGVRVIGGGTSGNNLYTMISYTDTTLQYQKRTTGNIVYTQTAPDGNGYWVLSVNSKPASSAGNIVLTTSDLANNSGYITLNSAGILTNKTWNGDAIQDAYISSANAWNAKENALPIGTTLQYLRGNKTLATFPTALSSFTNDVGYLTSASLQGSNFSLSSVGLNLDGQGVVLSTGQKGYVRVPYAGTIISWSLISDAAGSCTFDIWKSSTYPSSSDSICPSNKPTMSSANSAQSSTLTGWNTSVNAGDIFGWNLDSVTSLTRVILQVIIRRT